MLFLKRFVTTVVLFPFLFLVLSIGTLTIGGAVLGAKAASEQKATGFESGRNIGRKAGEEFGRKYSAIIFKGSALISLIFSIGISFSGILPWCRRDTPPPMPLR